MRRHDARQGVPEPIEMVDHRIGPEGADMDRGIAEGDGDNGQPGSLRGIDIGLRITNHNSMFRVAAGAFYGPRQVARIGLLHAVGVLAGDGCKKRFYSKFFKQLQGMALALVGAYRQPPAGPR